VRNWDEERVDKRVREREIVREIQRLREATERKRYTDRKRGKERKVKREKQLNNFASLSNIVWPKWQSKNILFKYYVPLKTNIRHLCLLTEV
jgi:hypothetical protein